MRYLRPGVQAGRGQALEVPQLPAYLRAGEEPPPPQSRGYTDAWLVMVKQAIRAHPYCAECGTSGDLTGDHIVPLSKGGANTPSNIQVLCRRCNSRKKARL